MWWCCGQPALFHSSHSTLWRPPPLPHVFNTGGKERLSQLDNLHDQKWYLMSILAEKMLGEIRDLPKISRVR